MTYTMGIIWIFTIVTTNITHSAHINMTVSLCRKTPTVKTIEYLWKKSILLKLITINRLLLKSGTKTFKVFSC